MSGTQRVKERQGSGTGTGAQACTHTQSIASNVWVCVHNLGYCPGGITVQDSAGETWFPNKIEHTNTNTTILYFGNATFGGKAYFS